MAQNIKAHFAVLDIDVEAFLNQLFTKQLCNTGRVHDTDIIEKPYRPTQIKLLLLLKNSKNISYVIKYWGTLRIVSPKQIIGGHVPLDPRFQCLWLTLEAMKRGECSRPHVVHIHV